MKKLLLAFFIAGSLSFANVGRLNGVHYGDGSNLEFTNVSTNQTTFTPGLPVPSHSEGLLFYDDDEKTLSFYNNENEVKIAIAHEIFIRATNKTGSTIPDGKVVFINGAQGNRPTVALAKADRPSTSMVLAMTTHPVENHTTGIFTSFGEVHDLDTSAYTAGTEVYLSDAVAGNITSNIASAPSFPIHVGTVSKVHATEGIVLVNMGPTDVVNQMVIQGLHINTDLTVSENFVMTPQTVGVVAATGIVASQSFIEISGSGGAINITASPQITAGVPGQLLILEGGSDTNTVQIDNGDGVHLHSRAMMGEHDSLLLMFNFSDMEWIEIARNFSASEKAWSFASPAGSSGTFYSGGFYEFGSSDNDFNPSITLGSANNSYAAHVFIVTAGGDAGGDTIIHVTGTRIQDSGTRTAAYTAVITINQSEATSTYHETPEKFIGQVTIAKDSGADVLANYGLAKYWDNNNNDFRVIGLEVTGRAGANDSSPDIALIHHKATGWTYNSGAEPTAPTPISSMDSEHSTESQYVNGEYFAWKRDNLSQSVAGGDGEGTIIRWVTAANKSIEIANFLLRVRPK